MTYGALNNVYIDQEVFDKLAYLLCTYQNDPVRKKLGEHLQTFINEYRSYMVRYMDTVYWPEDWSVTLNIYRTLKSPCVYVTLKFRDLNVQWNHAITEEMALKDPAWIVRRLENLTDNMEQKIKKELKPLPNDSAVPVSITNSGHYYIDGFEDDYEEPVMRINKTENIVISQCINALVSDLRRCGSTATKRMLLDNLDAFIKECDDFYAPFIAVKAHPEKWQIKLYTITDAPDPHKIWVHVSIRYDDLKEERKYEITDTYCSDRHMKTIAFLQELTESIVSTVNRRETLYKKTRLNGIYGAANVSRARTIETEINKMNEKEIEEYIKHDMEATEELMSIYRRYALNDLVKKVYFNKPYTVVIWANGAKTIVKCQKGEKYDPEKGLAMCFAKYWMGNDSFYYEIFKKYLPEKKKAAPKKVAPKKEATDKE